jgi:CRP-like cAMP-binding protein
MTDHEQIRERLRRLEDHTSELDDRVAAERAARQLLQRDVRWILRVSMVATAVVSVIMSLAAQVLTSLF